MTNLSNLETLANSLIPNLEFKYVNYYFFCQLDNVLNSVLVTVIKLLCGRFVMLYVHLRGYHLLAI